MTEPIRDWRGTEITPGALVIYGAPVGRSIEMVEAIVDTETPFTSSGRVWLLVIRRAYADYKDQSRVHVGADRLTVVTTLPPTTVPTVAEVAAQREAERRQHKANHATHSMPAPIRSRYATEYPSCTACGASYSQSFQRPCEVAA